MGKARHQPHIYICVPEWLILWLLWGYLLPHSISLRDRNNIYIYIYIYIHIPVVSSNQVKVKKGYLLRVPCHLSVVLHVRAVRIQARGFSGGPVGNSERRPEIDNRGDRSGADPARQRSTMKHI